MMFAEITAEGWTVIIGAIVLGVIQILNTVLTWLGNRKTNTLDAKQDQQTRMIQSTAASIARVEKQGDELSKSQLGKRK